jgi:hypothetical protein
VTEACSFAPLGVALVLVTVLAACGDLGGSDEGNAPGPYVASDSCPLKSPGEWEAFLRAIVEDENWVRTCSDLQNCDALVGAFREHVVSSILPVFEQCSADFARNPSVDHCTARLRRYVPVWLGQHVDDSYGFRQENPAYLAAHTGADMPPGMMEPPGALLEALPERATLEATARDHGWPYLTHESCLGGVRTFVNVSDPEGRFDQWMLVSLDATETRVDGDSTIMSFIAVQKEDANGNALPRVRMHFRDYVATLMGDAFTLELPENFGGKCYACHTSGLRQLISSAEATDLNERMLAYGLPDWNGTLEPTDHGPRLGESLGCTECHNGEDRGILTVSTSEGMLWQKVVGQLSMRSPRNGQRVPDEAAMALLERETTGNPPLTPDEALALEQARAEHLADYEVLVAERFPAWRAWALDVPCE